MLDRNGTDNIFADHTVVQIRKDIMQMKDSNLQKIINGFQAVIDNMPDYTTYEYPADNPNFDFKEVTKSVFDGMYRLIRAILQTEHFLRLKGKEGDFVLIYDTAEELEDFLRRSKNKGDVVIERLDYKGFLNLTYGNEIILCDYICIDKLPVVIFPLSTYPSSSNAEEPCL